MPWAWFALEVKADEMANEEDPIAGDPALLWVWTRYVGVLIALLAFAIGYGEVNLEI